MNSSDNKADIQKTNNNFSFKKFLQKTFLGLFFLTVGFFAFSFIDNYNKQSADNDSNFVDLKEQDLFSATDRLLSYIKNKNSLEVEISLIEEKYFSNNINNINFDDNLDLNVFLEYFEDIQKLKKLYDNLNVSNDKIISELSFILKTYHAKLDLESVIQTNLSLSDSIKLKEIINIRINFIEEEIKEVAPYIEIVKLALKKT